MRTHRHDAQSARARRDRRREARVNRRRARPFPAHPFGNIADLPVERIGQPRNEVEFRVAACRSHPRLLAAERLAHLRRAPPAVHARKLRHPFNPHFSLVVDGHAELLSLNVFAVHGAQDRRRGKSPTVQSASTTVQQSPAKAGANWAKSEHFSALASERARHPQSIHPFSTDACVAGESLGLSCGALVADDTHPRRSDGEC